MNICVCVKSVPSSRDINFDTKTGLMRRESGAAELNPYDLVAVEAALQCAEKSGDAVYAVSMGPKSSEIGLRTAMAMGVDEGFLLCSPAFAGADVSATAQTLAAFFKAKKYADLIICAKHSSDGDTGQTGAMLAECLQLPHAGGVLEIEELGPGFVQIKQQQDDTIMHLRLCLPCVLVVENSFSRPRLPGLKDTLRARKQAVQVFDDKRLDISRETCGLAGSATRVISLFVPPNERQGRQVSLDKLEILLPFLNDKMHKMGRADG